MMKRRTWLAVGFCAAAVAFFAACTDWTLWDNVFNRAGRVGTRGWTGGDGAISIRLPGAGDRTLWLFGDSIISGWNASTGQRTPNATIAFGTMIGAQTDTALADGNTISFWARDSQNAPKNITADVPTSPSLKGFFLPQQFGSLNNDTQVWPSGAFCYQCDDTDPTNDRVLVAFIEWRKSCNGQGFCFGAGTSMAIEVLRSYVAVIDTASSSPANWSVIASMIAGTNSAASSMNVDWGKSFVDEGGHLYIYGTRFSLASGTYDLVVAATTFGNLLRKDQWQYLKTDGTWASGAQPAPEQLKAVATNVGALDSVVRVYRDSCGDPISCTRYLLVHAHPGADHYLHVRVSDGSSWLSWPAITETTPRLELTSIDSSAAWDALAAASSTDCETVVNGVTDFRKCGVTYHGQGHVHLSDKDSHGLSSLLVSYIVPGAGAAQLVPGTEWYRPRFAKIPLDKLRPWCAQLGGGECWEGILNQHYLRPIAAAEKQEFGIDVRRARGTFLTTSIVNGTGDPDLYIRFDAKPAYDATDACRSTGGSWAESCVVRVPDKASTAWVGVKGASAGSYSLRTHHAGL